MWGDHQPVSFYEYYKTLAQNGGEFLNDDGTAVAFNTPEGVEAAEWLVGKSGTVMPTIEQGQGTPDFDTNLFKDGKLGDAAHRHLGVRRRRRRSLQLGHRRRAGQHRSRPARCSPTRSASRRPRSTSRRRRSGPSSSPRRTSMVQTPPRRRLGAPAHLRRGAAGDLPRRRTTRPTARRCSTRSTGSPCRRSSPTGQHGDAGHHDRGARRGAGRSQDRRRRPSTPPRSASTR